MVDATGFEVNNSADSPYHLLERLNEMQVNYSLQPDEILKLEEGDEAFDPDITMGKGPINKHRFVEVMLARLNQLAEGQTLILTPLDEVLLTNLSDEIETSEDTHFLENC
jgi:hypothetical protein